MKISPARTAAFDILLRIETARAFSSGLLASVETDLNDRDRSLCHNIVLGVLRRQIYLDTLIRGYTDSRKLDPDVVVSLRIGLFQLLFLDRVPAHSAVDESVRLIERAKKRSATGLVNAVLRRAIRQPYLPEFDDEMEMLSFDTSHPRWLVERWIAQYGREKGELIAKANNHIPKLSFRETAKNSEVFRSPNIRPSELVEGAFVADTASADLMKAAAEGEIYFQDEASQMVANSFRLKAGEAFLDLCAAPGGKVTLVAARHRSQPLLLVAAEKKSDRRSQLASICRAQGAADIIVLGLDATVDLPLEHASFDVVLVDSPCSGTGTIRHNPEIRYFLQPSDIDDLSRKQRKILWNASKMVRTGGILIYSTCSLEREENEAVVEDFLDAVTGFERVRPNVPERFLRADLSARTFPHRDDMDGFYIAHFRRR
ncbi:MAG TPA: 16S rRNA (cytosine(967)-C(5))-methyltransferase RsmB [Pyrinomonadaceae bacterium]|nr:16S rRNA (cytosine(967)-C(5))-methyltransferase RsmB [Pyrinomonadaceae bacterium]